MRRRNREKGSVVVEYSLAGIAAVCTLIGTFHLGLTMWNYHTLANAVTMAAQMASVRGRGCTEDGNTCSIRVGDIAERIAREATGVPAGGMEVTLTSASGATRVCRPLSSCFSDATVWPPSAANDNAPGSTVTVTARYRVPFPLVFFWPGAESAPGGTYTLAASSTQRIVF